MEPGGGGEGRELRGDGARSRAGRERACGVGGRSEPALCGGDGGGGERDRRRRRSGNGESGAAGKPRCGAAPCGYSTWVPPGAAPAVRGRCPPRSHRGGRGAETAVMGAAAAASLQDAIRTLNTLQTNASYLEQVKRERGDPRAQLEAMRGFLERSGLQVSPRGAPMAAVAPHVSASPRDARPGGLTRRSPRRSRTWIG